MKTAPNIMSEWKELARMLEGEWRGQSLDIQRARTLADSLLPQFPELRCTLTHLQARLRVTH
ncbi:MAG: hypothetical protein H7Y60_00770 [Rhodospirillaceae bacterium]|nr:hypothetical protein [Rhodospirillales bacterium]